MPATKENQHATLTLQGDWDEVRNIFAAYAESIRNSPDDRTIICDVENAERYPAKETVDTGWSVIHFTLVHGRFGYAETQAATGRDVVKYWVEIR